METGTIGGRYCKGCKRFKPADNFRKDGNGYTKPHCKDCNKEKKDALRVKNLCRLIDFVKANPCECGQTWFPAITFHHIDPSTKVSTISKMLKDGYSWNRIKAEVAKCQVLCWACHAKLHLAGCFAYMPDDLKDAYGL